MTGAIDPEIVRKARENLGRIASKNPELLGVTKTEDWIDVLKNIEEAGTMAKTIQVGVRLPLGKLLFVLTW